MKTFCSLINLIEKEDKSLYSAIKDRCAHRIVGPYRSARGLTFIFPNKEFIKTLIKASKETTSKLFYTLLKSLILPDKFETVEDFKSQTVGSKNRIVYEIKEVKKGSVTFASGAVIVPSKYKWSVTDAKFPIPTTVWMLKSGKFPLEGKDYKFPRAVRTKTGGNVPIPTDEYRKTLCDRIRQTAGTDMEAYRTLCCSLLNFIMKRDLKLYLTVVKPYVISMYCIPTLCALIQPGFKSGHFVPVQLLKEWNMTKLCVNSKLEMEKHNSSLIVKDAPSGLYKKGFSYSDLCRTRKTLIGNLILEDPTDYLSEITNMYTMFYSNKSLFSVNLSKQKLWRDELDYCVYQTNDVTKQLSMCDMFGKSYDNSYILKNDGFGVDMNIDVQLAESFISSTCILNVIQFSKKKVKGGNSKPSQENIQTMREAAYVLQELGEPVPKSLNKYVGQYGGC